MGGAAGCRQRLRNAIILVLALSVVIMITVVLLAEPLMPAGAIPTRRMMPSCCGRHRLFRIMALACRYGGVHVHQRGHARRGYTKPTMRVNVISNLVNICFNYLLIGGRLASCGWM